MAAGLTAQVSILVAVALAAMLNNAYKGTHVFHTAVFAPQSGQIFALKYASASAFLLLSFFFSSMAFCFLIDAGFLMSVVSCDQFSSHLYTQRIFERGFLMALIGNRILCMSFPLLLWMFGPLPVVLAAVGLVWGLYELDFVSNSTKSWDQTQNTLLILLPIEIIIINGCVINYVYSLQQNKTN